MDPLTLYTIGSGIYNVADGLKESSRLKGLAATSQQEADAAKLAGEQAYAEQVGSTKYKVKQAPTKAADLTLSLAEQGLDFARDRALAQEAGTLAGLRDDPRNVGALLRQLNQSGQAVQQAEQVAGQQSVMAQKIIDDSIYRQQEAERQRLAGLQQKYELDPAMAAYTQATGAASAYEQAASDARRQAIADSLAAGAQAIGMMKDKKKTAPKSEGDASAEFRKQQQQDNDLLLQSQLSQPIPITENEDVVKAGIASLYSDNDVFTQTPVELEPDLPVLEAPIYNEGIQMEGGPLAESGPERGIVDIRTQMQPEREIFQTIPPLNIDLYNQSAGNPYITGERALESMPNLGLVGPSVPPNYFTPSSQYAGSGVEPRLRDAIEVLPDGLFREVPLGMENELAIQPIANSLAYEAGGRYIGEEGGRTEGEFSHKTNKKAIIDEESGEKEGEMTGDETVIANPEQWENLESVKELLEYLSENPDMPKKEMKALLAKASKYMEFMDEPQFA